MKNVIRGGVDKLTIELDLSGGKVYVFGMLVHAGKSLFLKELFMHLVETEKPTDIIRTFEYLTTEESPEMVVNWIGVRIKSYISTMVDNKRVVIAGGSHTNYEELIRYLENNPHIQPGSIFLMDNMAAVHAQGDSYFNWDAVKQVAEKLKITIIATVNLVLPRDFYMVYRDYRRGEVPTHEQLKLFKEEVTKLRVAGKITADGIYAGGIDTNESKKSGKASFSLVDCSRAVNDNTAFYITTGE